MPDIHAKLLQPSASERWLSCPPSARLHARFTEKLGERSSEAAAEGTKAHSLGELKLRRAKGEINEFLYSKEREALGTVDEEMDSSTDEYVDTVLSEFYAAQKFCADAKLFVEVRLRMDSWAPDCFGTSDAVVVSDDILTVIDLKYGKGVPVSAVGNPQARLYALGAAAEYSERLGGLYAFERVKTMIVQPRLDSITEEELSLEELLEWGRGIKEPARLAYEGKGEFRVGEHCRWCAVKSVCMARAAEAMRLFETGLADTATLDSKDIPRILDVIPLAKEWIKGIEEYALAQAKQGVEYRGYKLVEGRKPSRKWTNEEEVINTLARAGYSAEQYNESGLKSVADLEKTLGKGTLNNLLGEYITQGNGNLTLVPDTDKREAKPTFDMMVADMVE